METAQPFGHSSCRLSADGCQSADPGPTADDRQPTTLYLIRHGETDWNRLGLYQGTTDIPLNHLGRQQASRLAEAMRGVHFGAAYSSPLARAIQTAEAVLQDRDLEIRILPELRELCYGLWQGRGIRPHGRCSPGLEWRWKQDPWSVRFPGGETLGDVRDRAAAALHRILAMHPGEPVLVSGHGHFNRVFLIEALGWPESRFWEIEQENTCCYRLDLGGTATVERVC